MKVSKKRGHKRTLSPTVKDSKSKKIRRSPSSSSSSTTWSSSSSSTSSSSDSSDSGARYKYKRKRKAKSPSPDTSSSSSSSSLGEKHKKKVKKVKEKEFKRKFKKCKKKNSKSDKDDKTKKEQSDENASADVPLHLMDKSCAMAPMTKEQWEKQQSVVRKVYDESTGRHRLIKGDGEVIEEIVSKERHRKINQQATKGDGDYFQRKLSSTISH